MPLLPDVTKWRRYLRFWGTDVQADVDDELRFHFEARAEELRARGVAPADVERTIREEFGDVEATRRQLHAIGARMERRRERRWWWSQLVADLRYALRGLRRSPGFTAAVIATLALGIGANAAIFSAVDLLLFRAPPLLDAPARTHRVYVSYPPPEPSGERFVLDVVPYVRYRELGAWTRGFERTALHVAFPMAVGTGQDARELPVAAVSASFFGFFDAPPALGRYFAAADDAPPAGAPVVVLSHATWQARFGGRPDVLGATLQVGPTVYTVIGVAPRRFVGLWPEQPPVAYVPVASYAGSAVRPGEPAWWTSYTSHVAAMLVRRKPDVPLARASAELNAALSRSVDAEGGVPTSLRPTATVAPVLVERGPTRTSAAGVAALVGGMALVVLLIACANVANLLLARALRRRREVAVRLSLGVSRGRLLAHLLTESVLLASLGGAAGLAVAQVGGAALRATVLPPGAPSSVLGDVRTLVLVGVAVPLIGVLTGLPPAWQAGRVALARDLRLGAREGTPHSARTRAALLVLQGALSVLLLVGAGLFVRSLQHARQLRLGYDVAPVLTADLQMRGVRLDSARTAALYDRLLAAARAVPGVERAALRAHVPLGGSTFMGAVRVPGLDPARMRRLPNFHRNVVSREYFATMGTRILHGRGFGPQDVAGAPGAVVVSAGMARLLWPDRSAVGQCITLEARRPAPCAFVVGVAEDIRHSALGESAGLYYYVPATQVVDRFGLGLMVRTRGDAARHAEAVRQALQREMPGASYVTVAPFADVVREQTRSWRLGATMFVVFGGLALTLAAVGLYGVIAYEVTQRAHEMGVRVALGARTRDVLWVGVRRGVLLAGLGLVLGTVAALATAGRIAPLLFGVSPRDPLVYGVVAVATLAVSLAASVFPARRAARVDPTVALRAE